MFVESLACQLGGSRKTCFFLTPVSFALGILGFWLFDFDGLNLEEFVSWNDDFLFIGSYRSSIIPGGWLLNYRAFLLVKDGLIYLLSTLGCLLDNSILNLLLLILFCNKFFGLRFLDPFLLFLTLLFLCLLQFLETGIFDDFWGGVFNFSFIGILRLDTNTHRFLFWGFWRYRLLDFWLFHNLFLLFQFCESLEKLTLFHLKLLFYLICCWNFNLKGSGLRLDKI